MNAALAWPSSRSSCGFRRQAPTNGGRGARWVGLAQWPQDCVHMGRALRQGGWQAGYRGKAAMYQVVVAVAWCALDWIKEGEWGGRTARQEQPPAANIMRPRKGPTGGGGCAPWQRQCEREAGRGPSGPIVTPPGTPSQAAPPPQLPTLAPGSPLQSPDPMSWLNPPCRRRPCCRYGCPGGASCENKRRQGKAGVGSMHWQGNRGLGASAATTSCCSC